MNTAETKDKIRKLSEKITVIETRAAEQSRELTAEEGGIICEMQGSIEALTKSLPQDRLTVIGPHGIRNVGGAYALKGPNDKKDWKSLFGTGGYSWPDKETNFFSASFSGRHHPGLIRAGMTEGTPSSGGFLVPVEQAAKIHAVSLENEIVQPRSYVQPMASNTCKIPAMSIGDHGTALFGGFTASYTGEAGTISEHSPKARSMELNAKKLTGLIRFSSELSADTPGGMSQIETLCGKGLAWYRDKAFLKGTGAGEPLGVLRAPCTIVV
jgi:HK97 family phage major capsid protein